MKRDHFIADGGGRAVLALHSSTSSKAQWRTLPDALDARYRVVAVDLHGYGGNPLPAEDRRFELTDEVNLVATSAVEALGTFGPMHVVGHSYGAAVALSLARMRPELVSSLTLYEPVCFALLDMDGPHLHVVRALADRVSEHVERGELAQASRLFLEYWGGRGAYDNSKAATRERIHEAIRKVPLDFSALLEAPGSPYWYSPITVPTLLMSGRSSTESAREIARILWTAIPASRLVELEGDHLLPLTAPHIVNAGIAKFLDSLPKLAGSRRIGSIV